MKKLLCLFIVVWLNQVMYSQTFNYAHSVGPSEACAIAGLNKHTFVIVKRNNLYAGCSDIASIVGFSSNNKELFSFDLNMGSWLNLFSLTVLSDSTVLAVSGTSMAACDVMSTKVYMTKLDINGKIIWQKIIPYTVNSVQAINGSAFIIVGGGVAIWFDSMGNENFFLGLYYSVKQVNSLTVLDNDRVLVNCKDQASQFVVFDSSMNMISQSNAFGDYDKVEQMKDGSIIARSGGILHRYTKELLYKCTSAQSFSNHVISEFTCYNDSIFVTGANSNNEPFFAILDTTFTPLVVSKSNIKNAVGTGIYVNKNDVRLSLRCNIGKPESYGYGGYFEGTFDGSLIADSDIGVVGIRNVQYTTEVNYTKYGYPYVEYIMSAEVEVKNFGKDTISAVSLNHFSYGMYAMGQRYTGLSKQYDVFIPPLSTVSVPTGTFKTMFSAATASPSYLLADICFHTTAPNNKIDINNANDYKCFNYELAVGVNGTEAESLQVTIYPNPAADQIIIHAPAEITVVSIFDSSGRLLKTMVGNDNAMSIETGGFVPGMFFVEVNTGKGTIRQKLIVH